MSLLFTMNASNDSSKLQTPKESAKRHASNLQKETAAPVLKQKSAKQLREKKLNIASRKGNTTIKPLAAFQAAGGALGDETS